MKNLAPSLRLQNSIGHVSSVARGHGRMPSGPRNTDLVIGITGPIGSGVSTTSRALERNGFRRISVSGAIKAKLRKDQRLAPDRTIDEKTVHDFRKRLQDIGNEGRQKSPSHWIEQALKISVPVGTELVIDGIRNLAEVQVLRQRFSKFFLVAVNASPEVRWHRSQKLYDGNFKAFERDDTRDQDEEGDFGQQVSKCVAFADYVLVNEINEGSQSAQLKNIFNRIGPDVTLMREVDRPAGGPALFKRPPTQQEAHMATAYAQSHLSQCLKRHVGAVIVAANGLGLSMGFNENPIDMKPCTNQVSVQ
jgi:dephospho-CoA kinase